MSSVLDELAPIVGSVTAALTNGRVFLVEPPLNYVYQGPYVVMRGAGLASNEEITRKPTGFQTERIEFSCRARQNSDFPDGGNRTCRTLAGQIKAALRAYTSASFYGASFASQFDGFDDSQMTHVVSLDMEVDYAEAIP